MEIKANPTELFNEFLKELEATDETLFSPSGEKKSNEKRIGFLPDHIRKIYALSEFYRREEQTQKLQLSWLNQESEEFKEKAPQWVKLEGIYAFLRHAMWMMIREQFNLWGEKNTIGIRKNWEIVVETGDNNPLQGLADKIKDLLS